MSHLPDNKRLLKDVLSEESAAGFREALLDQTLSHVRGRRRRRQAQRVGGGLALLAVTTLLVWHNLPGPRTQQSLVAAPQSLNYQLVQTQLLPATMQVESHPLTERQIVATFATANVVSTTSGGFREIGDRELLALAPGPAALVRRGPHKAELVFPNATDEEPPPF